MAQNKLITDLVSLVTPNNDDLFVVVDNTTNPSLSVTKKISYANLKEALQDMIDILVYGGTGIDASYDDGNNTITLSVIADSTVQQTIVSNSGSTIGTRQEVNFISGADIVISGADNVSDNRVDLTVRSLAVSSGANLPIAGSGYDVFAGAPVQGDGTKEAQFRPLKAGSSTLTLDYGDANNSVVVDIDPTQIDINSLSTVSPLAITIGGTNATTASGARANLGAAKAGANDDIASLSGLTTPLSVSQGGTGANNSQQALTNLGGLKYAVDTATVGESILADGSNLVGNEYRAEFKGVRAATSKITVSTVSNDVAIDANADQILSAATTNVNFNGVRLTNAALPVASTDVATKEYADNVAQGLNVKLSSKLASTAGFSATYFNSTGTVSSVDIGTDTLTINNHGFDTGERVVIRTTGSLPGGLALDTEYFIIDTGTNAIKLAATEADSGLGNAVDLTSTGSGVHTVAHTLYLKATSNGALSIDSTTPNVGERVLLKNQSPTTQNGIYVVNVVGDGSTPAVLTRAADANAALELSAGSFTYVEGGASNGGISYVQINDIASLDLDGQDWTLFTSTAIPVNSVNNSKLAQVAEATVKGRQAGTGTGNVEDLTADQLIAIVNTATAAIDCGTY